MRCEECGSVVMSDNITSSRVVLCESCGAQQDYSSKVFNAPAFEKSDYFTAQEFRSYGIA